MLLNHIGQKLLKYLIKKKKGTKEIYNTYLSLHLNFQPKCESKWNKELKFPQEFDWKLCYRNIYSVTKDAKLIWFNLRVIHRILGTNKYLFLSKIKSNNLCSFCHLEAESIVHILFNCSKVLPMWSLLQDQILEKTGKTFKFDLCAVILGLPEEDKVVNLIMNDVAQRANSILQKLSQHSGIH
jgi:hypothetical protein